MTVLDNLTEIPAEAPLALEPIELAGFELNVQHVIACEQSPYFRQAWLTTFVSDLRATGQPIDTAALLVASKNSSTFDVTAFWSVGVAEALANGQGAKSDDLKRIDPLIKQAAAGSSVWTCALDNKSAIAIPVGVAGRVSTVLLLVIQPMPLALRALLLKRTMLAMGSIRAFDIAAIAARLERRSIQTASVLELLSHVLSTEPLHVCLVRLVNAVAETKIADTVAIGWGRGTAVQIKAISKTAEIEKSGSLTGQLQQAMAESMFLASPVFWVSSDQASGSDTTNLQARMTLAAGGQSCATYPLQYQGTVMGSLVLVRKSPIPFSDEDIQWLDALTGLLPQSIHQNFRSRRRFPRVFAQDVVSGFRALVGSSHLIAKFCTLLFCCVVAILTLVPVPFRITATAVLEGAIQRSVAAPFEGYLAKTLVRPGDKVSTGQPLFALDDRDLFTERSRWQSEMEQAQKRLREALAKGELAGVGVARAQQDQAQAQLSLVQQKIDRAVVRSTIDGVVISGDLSQMIGGPVENGEALLEIAPLNDYRLVLQLDERDIALIKVDQTGDLMLQGAASGPIKIKVARITPIASTQNGQTFFRVETTLLDEPKNLRPGLEGIAKIAIGSTSIWTLSTRRIKDWLQINLWKYLP